MRIPCMTPSTTPTHGPAASWIGTGISLLIAGAVMIPFNVVTSVGIGCIIGGLSVIGAAFMRGTSED